MKTACTRLYARRIYRRVFCGWENSAVHGARARTCGTEKQHVPVLAPGGFTDACSADGKTPLYMVQGQGHAELKLGGEQNEYQK